MTTIKKIICIITVLVLCACGGGSSSTNSPPIASAGSNHNVVVGDLAILDATASTDANNDTLSYVWVLSSRPAGSTASLSSNNIAKPQFVADKLGNYTATVTVTDGQGGSSTASVTVTAVVNSAPIANAGLNQKVNLNAIVTLSGDQSTDADSDPLTYAWQFVSKPAASSAVLSNPNTISPTFVPNIDGTYVVRLTVTDNHGAASATPAVVAVTVSTQVAMINNAFTVACGASNCAAASPSSYSSASVGSVGVWRYNNTTTSPATINVDISGVSAGKQVTLAFTNGASTDAPSLPAIGTQASLDLKAADSLPAPVQAPLSRKEILHNQHEEAHHLMLDKNARSKERLILANASAEVLQSNTTPQATPVLNASKVWMDTFDTPVSYTTTNKFICALPSGRKIVFWQDTADANMTPAMLTTFTTAACGTTGGFARINALIGDAWGAHNYSNLIKDTATVLQDINVIFIQPPASVGWAGYFDSVNNFTTSAANPSNEALAFFINTTQIPLDINYYVSTLFHEATHMVNFYQNYIKLGKKRLDFLEETSAMMSEDIVTPAVTGYNKILEYRLPLYLTTGGNVSLNNWVLLSSVHYHMGGAFGAFLNRQYGLNIYKQIVSGCTSGLAKTDDYACLDQVIINNGGFGVKEELTRLGATLYARLPATGNPTGYGFEAKSDGAYNLMAFDLTGLPIVTARPLTTYPSMSQTYVNDTVATGKTRYIRNNVVVPAGTNVQVIIK
jgi:hypothetical protein